MITPEDADITPPPTDFPNDPSAHTRGGWREHLDAQGREVPAWSSFLERLRRTPPAEIDAWRESIARDQREDGLTFTLHSAPETKPRREQVDPVPWIFDPGEWAGLERGIAQRCRLLEVVIRDLTGPRTLLSRGVLPAELVFADPAYLRPCVGLPSRMGALLFQAGVDVARGADGRFRVLEDRAQAPSGAGFALESRMILGRVFPRFIAELPVRRLATYFRTFRESLLRMYEGRRLEPRVVLLTPGPYSPLYFEHAYLAAYLGYTLVQGSDLMVRNGAVRLKTLEGLQPVDIVYRHVDAAFLDPLELRRDSYLGVPGLLGALRAGKVSVLNHPGCGVVENSGFMAFYPSLCRELLGEDLLLPSVATWWCGQSKECAHVLDHLSELVVKPLQRTWNEPAVDGGRCARGELEALRRKILANPRGYVGQERMETSRLPTLGGGGVEECPARLRAFASASPEGIRVMPGALARTVPSGGGMDVAGQGALKDVWVLGENPEPHRSLWLDREVREAGTRFTGGFTSRSAENLFWVGRYAERVARQARLVRGMGRLEVLQPETGAQSSAEYAKLLELLETFCLQRKQREQGEQGEAETDSERLRRAVCGEDGGLVNNLKALVSAAYTARDIWSQDSWRTLVAIEALADSFRGLDPEGSGTSALAGDLLEKLNAFQGLNISCMNRESGWSMMMLGRTLESGIGLCDCVRGLLGPATRDEDPISMMELLLQQNENLITYRRHYRTTPRLESVLELVIASERNPRGMVFLLGRAPAHLDELPPPMEPGALDAHRLDIKRLRARLLEENGAHPDDQGEYPVLAEVRKVLEVTSDAVSSAYFSHTALRPREEF